MINKIAIIIFSFFIAIALTIFPVPHWAIWLRPLWVPMLLCCWVLVRPQWVHIGYAFFLGLFLDVLLGTMLGVHALGLSLLCYLIAKYQRRIILCPLVQQSIAVFIVLFCYQFLLFVVQAFFGQLPGTWAYWLPVFPSVIVWPLMYLLVRQLGAGEKFGVGGA